MVFKVVIFLTILHLVMSLPNPGVEFQVNIDAGGNVENVNVETHMNADEDDSDDGPLSNPTSIPACDESQGYMRVLGRCFKLFTDADRNWYESVVKCRDEKMVMVTTTDADANNIRDALIETYGGQPHLYAWLDAKYNGAQIVFNDGERIANDNDLWWSGGSGTVNPITMPQLKPDYCLLMLNYDGFKLDHPSKPYWTTPCASTRDGRKAFCELI